MEQKLEAAQKQIITQQMLQTISILQMSTQELDEFLENAALENPVIEYDANVLRDGERSDREADSEIREQRTLEWIDSDDRQNRSFYQGDRDTEDGLENIRTPETGQTLQEFLHFQLIREKFSREDEEILEFMIECIDRRGYFQEDLSFVANQYHTSEEHAKELLVTIQKLDPAGVGARSLSECLRLQLERNGKKDTLAWHLATDTYLMKLAKNHMKEVAAQEKVPIADVVEAFHEIQALTPTPGASFRGKETLSYVRPDAVIVKKAEKFIALIPGEGTDVFRINDYYRHMAEVTTDEEARQYLRKKIQNAENLARDINNRTSTLAAICRILVEKQHEFFEKGPGHKVPLRLVDLADEADVHESTVSRVLREKYLQCSWGIFPLNYFLTGSAAINEKTGEEQTQEQIQREIRRIIDEENKAKPLSDNAIQKKLEEVDINISRRTVNKYRSIMGIPDKIGRKTW